MAQKRKKKKAPARAAKRGAVQSREAGIVLTDEQKRARRARNVAIAVSLAALALLFYVVTLVKGPGVLNRPL